LEVLKNVISPAAKCASIWCWCRMKTNVKMEESKTLHNNEHQMLHSSTKTLAWFVTHMPFPLGQMQVLRPTWRSWGESLRSSQCLVDVVASKQPVLPRHQVATFSVHCHNPKICNGTLLSLAKEMEMKLRAIKTLCAELCRDKTGHSWWFSPRC